MHGCLRATLALRSASPDANEANKTRGNQYNMQRIGRRSEITAAAPIYPNP